MTRFVHSSRRNEAGVISLLFSPLALFLVHVSPSIVLQLEIDKANDPKKTLAFHRTSTQFGEFMDKLLLEIGEYRKGGSDEPALVAADA